jgi:hypothetical protein
VDSFWAATNMTNPRDIAMMATICQERKALGDMR